jgi:DNA-binding CsgD family transcriptional regulator
MNELNNLYVGLWLGNAFGHVYFRGTGDHLFQLSHDLLPVQTTRQKPIMVVDPSITQNIVAYGSGFLMASYFPYYFYRGFELKHLRFHAIYGVPLFLLLPYLIFFVIAYSINGNLDFAIKYGIIVPFFYSIVLLWAILRSIRMAYQNSRDQNEYREEIMVYCAVLPWVFLTAISYFHFSQLAEVLCTNTGFILITLIFISKSIKRARSEYEQLKNVTIDGMNPDTFQRNCLYYGLTKTEIPIVQMLYEGLSNKEIANQIFISEETVKKHIQNMFRKTGVKNRSALIHKLQNTRI